MTFLDVDLSLCKKDGICSKVCPVGIIKEDEERLPFIKDSDSRKCMKCGQCVAFCPFDACSVKSLPKENYIKVDKASFVKAEAADVFMKSRRSVRKFRKKTVSREEIQSLLDVAVMAPRAKNNDYVRYILLEGEYKMMQVADLVCNYYEEIVANSVKGARDEAVIHAKLLVRAHKNGVNVLLRDAPQLILSVAPSGHHWYEDGVISLAYMELAAHARGIGMCWAGYFVEAVRNYKPLMEYLKINQDEYVCAAQMVGYSAFGRSRRIPSGREIKLEVI